MARRDAFALLAGVRAGDEEAFVRLVDMYFQRLTRFAYAIVTSRAVAEDTVQAVFVQLWERRASLDPALSVGAYLYRLVRNRALDERRANIVRARHRDHVQSAIAADLSSGTVPSPEARVLDQATMETAMQRLSEQRRVALRLRYHDELSYQEIGEVLMISAEAAKKLVLRAIDDLRKILGVSR